MSLPIQNIDFFENIDTQEKIYWLGFIYGDGCIRIGKNGAYKFIIELNEKDSSHLELLANLFGKKLKTRERFTSKLVSLEINNKTNFYNLVSHGIKPRKTYLRDTEVFKSIPDNSLNHFIRGFFDADGSISTNNYNNITFNFTSGNYNFLEKIEECLIKNISLNKVKIHQHTENWSILAYSGRKNSQKFYNWLYKDATIYLKRKKDTFEKILTVIYKDIELPPYKNVARFGRNSWHTTIWIDGKQIYIGNYPSELEAAYWNDMEQVRRRGENAKRYMNFPSKYEEFVQWISEGY